MITKATIDSSLKSEYSSNFFSRLYLISTSLSLISVAGLMYLTSWFIAGQQPTSDSLLNVAYASLASYFASSLLMHKLGRFPGTRPLSYLIPTVAIVTLAMIALINFLRIDYSRSALVYSFFIVLVISYIEFRITQSKIKGHYAIVPFGFYKELTSCDESKFEVLSTPGFGTKRYNGLIVDNNADIPPHWQQFIAETLALDIPVLNSVTAYESITGKSPLDHYGEISYGELKPAPLYLASKRILESSLILLSTPVTMPLILLVALAVKLESKGPAFFVQKRVGKGGKEFSMYKIRSMCLDSEVNGAQFAGEDDPRITRIGRFIRKMRIDEMPQFLNILKGDMALIGPRPEQASFVKEFEQSIPLYSYRHVVRPGITGWAQVTHGYAADEDETREKLSHDFYYVKNLNLWLDLDIVFKTIKTMLTGFGAR